LFYLIAFLIKFNKKLSTVGKKFMSGLFRALFGSKTKYVDERETQNSGTTNENKEDFFLNPDEAQTFGNIEYMRKSKTIRKTFPKTKSNQTTEVFNEVSSIEQGRITNNQTSQPAPTSQPKPKAEPLSSAQNPQTNSDSRRSDNSMDMFRNMAREIRKPSNNS
jgi:hypothetical protein